MIQKMQKNMGNIASSVQILGTFEPKEGENVRKKLT